MAPPTRTPASRRGRPLRLGVFGGTFDPPHAGHLMIAERARDQLRLDRVVFIPCGTPPHKRRRGLTPAVHRVAMTRLAIRANPAFTVSTLETERDGPSYTVDTLRALRAREVRARLSLLIGEDGLDEFHTWHDPEAILALATLVVAPRPVAAAPSRGPARRGAGRATAPAVWLDGPRLALSSSEVRELMRKGRSVRYLVPDPVARYVARHRLYLA